MAFASFPCRARHSDIPSIAICREVAIGTIPVSRVRPEEVELDLLRSFDFDKLGYRDFRYFEVVVHASTMYADIIGRAVLIEVEHARVLFDKRAPQPTA